jgi:hypothetical protein
MRISESTRRSLTVAGANDSWIEFRTRHGFSQANAFTATETASALKGRDFSRAAAVANSNRLEPLGCLWFPQPFFRSQASSKTLFASETVGSLATATQSRALELLI